MSVEVICKIGTWFTWKIYHWTPSWFFKKMQRDPLCLCTLITCNFGGAAVKQHLVNSFVLVCFALPYLLFCFVFLLFWERTYNKELATTLILKALISYGAKWKAPKKEFILSPFYNSGLKGNKWLAYTPDKWLWWLKTWLVFFSLPTYSNRFSRLAELERLL